MSQRNTIRVKIDQLKNLITIVRLNWNEDQTELLGKECLDAVGNWIEVGEGHPYLWISADILLNSPHSDWFDAANWQLVKPD